MRLSDFQEHAAAPQIAFSRPRVLISAARAAYVGPSMRLSPHKNSVATVAIALDEPFALSFLDESKQAETIANVALIVPGRLHHLRARGAMAVLYLDALDDDYRQSNLARLEAPKSTVATAVRRALLGADARATASAQIALISSCLGIPTRKVINPAIAAALRAIDRNPQSFASVADAVAISGLSPSRFQHVFRAETGTTFRRYRVWKRMSAIARAVERGASLTAAAHSAGFSSSAHLATSFRSMFGVSPSELIAAGTQFAVDPGNEDPTERS